MTQAAVLAQMGGQNQTFRNRIINGAMMIDARNAGASVTGDGLFPVDRWKCSSAGGGAFSMQQSNTAPSGFSNSVVCTVTTADSSIASTDEYSYRQFIEGFNFADMAWGTASAATVTLSFWVRSSVTGTYAVGLRNSAGNRTYPATYTISSANTWEQKTITIAGDTSGTWVGSTNGIGVGVIFSLGAGSNFQGTANSWNASGTWSTSSATQWIATNGATFYITGVQLEKGTVATPFEQRLYGTELALCQRYFYVAVSGSGKYWGLGQNYSTTTLTGFIPFPVTMRTAPTSASTSGSSYYSLYRNGTNDDFNSITIEAAQVQGTGFYNNSEISGTAGSSGNLYTNNASSFIAFQAEL